MLKGWGAYQEREPRLHKAPTSSQLPKSGWYLKKTGLLQQQLSLTSQCPNEFTIAQERMVLKKNMATTAAIILDFTKPRRDHNCPRAYGIKQKLVWYSNNYPCIACISWYCLFKPVNKHTVAMRIIVQFGDSTVPLEVESTGTVDDLRKQIVLLLLSY